MVTVLCSVQIQVALRSKFDDTIFLSDLAECTAAVRSDPKVCSMIATPVLALTSVSVKAAPEGMAAIYGMAEKIPSSSGIIDRILKGYLDAMYR